MSEAVIFLTLVATVAGGTAVLTSPAGLAGGHAVENKYTDAADVPHFVYSDDGIFVSARADDKRIRFMVDTGASVTILSAKDAEALGIKSTNFREIRGVGGRIYASAARIDLEIAGTTMSEFDILITDQVPHSLLGRDAMRKLGQPRIVFQQAPA